MLACLAAIVGSAAVAPAKTKKPLTKKTWLSKTTITEYYPAPEEWFVGAREKAPGLKRKSRVDWLYSARGIAMEGDGLGTDGKRYHIENVGSGGWVARNGKTATFGSSDKSKQPYWRSSGYWRNKKKGVTFKLEDGGWSAGKGRRHIKPNGITFGKGPSRDLTYYRSVAVDPKLIPLGSLVYSAKYKSLNDDGWFKAEDTGGAIIGHHIDVYRKPPDSADDEGRYYSGQRIFVVPKSLVKQYAEAERNKDSDGLPAPPESLTD